jgi:hypothetical protein
MQDPGRWGGRELGRLDPAGNESQPNKEFALWLHELVFSGDLDATWKREILPFVKTGVRLVVDVELSTSSIRAGPSNPTTWLSR